MYYFIMTLLKWFSTFVGQYPIYIDVRDLKCKQENDLREGKISFKTVHHYGSFFDQKFEIQVLLEGLNQKDHDDLQTITKQDNPTVAHLYDFAQRNKTKYTIYARPTAYLLPESVYIGQIPREIYADINPDRRLRPMPACALVYRRKRPQG